MKRKIAIFTWYNLNRNFGQTLQAYALQKTLEGLGHEVITISYDKELKHKYQYLPYSLTKYVQTNFQYIKQQSAFNKFIYRHMKVSPAFCSKEEIAIYLRRHSIDCLVCGSDQIWNPVVNDDVFFLEIPIKNAVKIAYAPSMIGLEYMEAYRNVLEQSMKHIVNLDKVSVRERSGEKIIKSISGIEVPVLIDPVFLLKENGWKKLVANKTAHSKPYIICYFLGRPQKHISDIMKIGKWYNISNYIFIQNQTYTIKKNDTWSVKENIGPGEFLELLFHASMVCTDSFHGTAFSVIFEKQFFVFDRCGYIGKEFKNSDRINSLMAQLKLSDRYISCQKPLPQGEIDYTNVNELLGHEREKSFQFLKSGLKIRKDI